MQAGQSYTKMQKEIDKAKKMQKKSLDSWQSIFHNLDPA
jgi:hypothetical protein